MANKDKSKAEKGKQGKKGKGGKGDAEAAAPYSSIATHPRASASVRRIKGWTGLAAFIVAAALSAKADVPFVQLGLRALSAGIAGYLLAWWAGVQVWRHLMLAEQRAAAEEITRRRAERSNPEARADGR